MRETTITRPSNEKSVTDILRGVFSSVDKFESWFGPFPIVNVIPEAARVINVAGLFALDVLDGKPLNITRQEATGRMAEILVDVLPTGTLPLKILGLHNPLKKIVARAGNTAGELISFNFKGAWAALTTGKIPAYDKGSGLSYVFDRYVVNGINWAAASVGITKRRPQSPSAEPRPDTPVLAKGATRAVVPAFA